MQLINTTSDYMLLTVEAKLLYMFNCVFEILGKDQNNVVRANGETL